MTETCKHCGAVILPKDHVFPRSPKRQAILELVRARPGINSERILAKVWRKDADDRSINLVSVTISQMNRELRRLKLGFRLAGHTGRNGGYTLIEAKHGTAASR